ncbi:MAG TPA: ADP-ribosylglycohydrolase family protein, partial [Devosia sp.]|nr:ADP-ribosylglycohydrolase family protein [Devosia sp.]
KPEWGGVTRFTWNRGYLTLEGGELHVHTATDADAWTGNAYLRDQRVTAELTPLAGGSHLVSARVQGTARFYAGGFESGEAVIVRQDHGATVLARTPFVAEPGRRYRLELEVLGDRLALSIDGKPLLTATDNLYRYGMAGVRMASAGRMSVARLTVEDF